MSKAIKRNRTLDNKTGGVGVIDVVILAEHYRNVLEKNFTQCLTICPPGVRRFCVLKEIISST